MKYGYFKKQNCGFTLEGALEYPYRLLNKTPNIKIYYDRCGKGRPFQYKLLKQLKSGDSLYVLNIHDVGNKIYDIFPILETFKSNNIKLFIKDTEIDLIKVFDKIEEMKKFNKEHLESKIYNTDIYKLAYEELAKY